jgi:hypothetical protein
MGRSMSPESRRPMSRITTLPDLAVLAASAMGEAPVPEYREVK